MHVKIQADYAERNDGERVMTMPTTPMRHSPAFDIVAQARGRRSDCSAGSCPRASSAHLTFVAKERNRQCRLTLRREVNHYLFVTLWVNLTYQSLNL